MQQDTITLHVDAANNGTPSDKVYTRWDEQQNRTVYIANNDSPAMRDRFSIARSLPTRVGNFKGVAKTSIKFTKDVEVPGVDSTTNVQSSAIGEVNFSIPVGWDVDSLKAFRQTIIAALDDDTFMDKLNIQLTI